MNTFLPNYKIRPAQIEDLPALAEIELAAATLFCDTPYASLELTDSKIYNNGFMLLQYRLKH